ncbi:UDP-glycosyltransferase UGT5-like [Zophobas morio]|uniref:UDP-glycosyltransferase UGT5-like n=1 Tax=Zophobas morio TaxID=2755281 RepID=UPI00308356A0
MVISLWVSRPLVPHVFEVGGLHIENINLISKLDVKVNSSIMKTLFLRLILATSCLSAVYSYKLLVVIPSRSPSHSKLFLPLTQALAEKGHQVTVVGHFSLQNPPPNYNYISLDCQKRNTQKPPFSSDLKDYQGTAIERWSATYLLHQMGRVTCQEDFASPGLKHLINRNETFDLIIAQYFCSDCFLSLAKKFKAPVIGFSVCVLLEWISEIFANPTHPGYIPNVQLLHSNRIPFLGKVENLILGFVQQLYYSYVMTREGEDVAREYFGEEVSFRGISLGASLLLGVTHFTIHLPRPLVPAIVDIGTTHITKVNRLPDVSTITYL